MKGKYITTQIRIAAMAGGRRKTKSREVRKSEAFEIKVNFIVGSTSRS